MNEAFSWLSQLIETFYRFFPHIVIIRATHSGVKWIRGSKSFLYTCSAKNQSS